MNDLYRSSHNQNIAQHLSPTDSCRSSRALKTPTVVSHFLFLIFTITTFTLTSNITITLTITIKIIIGITFSSTTIITTFFYCYSSSNIAISRIVMIIPPLRLEASGAVISWGRPAFGDDSGPPQAQLMQGAAPTRIPKYVE